MLEPTKEIYSVGNRRPSQLVKIRSHEKLNVDQIRVAAEVRLRMLSLL